MKVITVVQLFACCQIFVRDGDVAPVCYDRCWGRYSKNLLHILQREIFLSYAVVTQLHTEESILCHYSLHYFHGSL